MKSKYFILGSAPKVLLDPSLLFPNLTVEGQTLIVVGSSAEDALVVRPGLVLDFSLSQGSSDKVYLPGSFSDYVLFFAGNQITLERNSGVNLERVTVVASSTVSDRLVFSNGTVSTFTLLNALKSAGKISLPVPDLTLESWGKPKAPFAPGSTLSAQIKAFAMDPSGTTFAPVKPGVSLIAVGSTGVDKVYVADGSVVDTTLLGAGIDLVHFRGKWADYSRTVAGTTVTFSRTIGGQLEQVRVSANSGPGNDLLIFADGAVRSLSVRDALRIDQSVALNTIASFDATQSTPGIGPQTPPQLTNASATAASLSLGFDQALSDPSRSLFRQLDLKVGKTVVSIEQSQVDFVGNEVKITGLPEMTDQTLDLTYTGYALRGTNGVQAADFSFIRASTGNDVVTTAGLSSNLVDLSSGGSDIVRLTSGALAGAGTVELRGADSLDRIDLSSLFKHAGAAYGDVSTNTVRIQNVIAESEGTSYRVHFDLALSEEFAPEFLPNSLRLALRINPEILDLNAISYFTPKGADGQDIYLVTLQTDPLSSNFGLIDLKANKPVSVQADHRVLSLSLRLKQGVDPRSTVLGFNASEGSNGYSLDSNDPTNPFFEWELDQAVKPNLMLKRVDALGALDSVSDNELRYFVAPPTTASGNQSHGSLAFCFDTNLDKSQKRSSVFELQIDNATASSISAKSFLISNLQDVALDETYSVADARRLLESFVSKTVVKVRIRDSAENLKQILNDTLFEGALASVHVTNDIDLDLANSLMMRLGQYPDHTDSLCVENDLIVNLSNVDEWADSYPFVIRGNVIGTLSADLDISSLKLAKFNHLRVSGTGSPIVSLAQAEDSKLATISYQLLLPTEAISDALNKSSSLVAIGRAAKLQIVGPVKFVNLSKLASQSNLSAAKMVFSLEDEIIELGEFSTFENLIKPLELISQADNAATIVENLSASLSQPITVSQARSLQNDFQINPARIKYKISDTISNIESVIRNEIAQDGYTDFLSRAQEIRIQSLKSGVYAYDVISQTQLTLIRDSVEPLDHLYASFRSSGVTRLDEPNVNLDGWNQSNGYVKVEANVDSTTPNFIIGSEGSDELIVYRTNDTVVGGGGNDTIFAGLGDDSLEGGAGDDSINGDSGNDTIFGGGGADTLLGGDGNDDIFGEIGRDYLAGGNSNDRLDGGEGEDELQGNGANDTLIGGEGSDYLVGGDGDDELWGGFGDDTLLGGGNDDILNGESGSDTLNGGVGFDTLVGGDGADSFVFYPGDHPLGGTSVDDPFGRTDVIMDFDPSEDTIVGFSQLAVPKIVTVELATIIGNDRAAQYADTGSLQVSLQVKDGVFRLSGERIDAINTLADMRSAAIQVLDEPNRVLAFEFSNGGTYLYQRGSTNNDSQDSFIKLEGIELSSSSVLSISDTGLLLHLV